MSAATLYREAAANRVEGTYSAIIRAFGGIGCASYALDVWLAFCGEDDGDPVLGLLLLAEVIETAGGAT